MNQCDGCKRGMPLKDGIHYTPGDVWDKIACTAFRYDEDIQDENWDDYKQKPEGKP